jgi:hypothetical protein
VKTSRKPKRRKAARRAKEPACQALQAHEERLSILERWRRDNVDPQLQRLGHIDATLQHIYEGLRATIDCNGYIVRELQHQRRARGEDESEQLNHANDSGEAWKRKPLPGGRRATD